ncbi:hypothetical protein ABFS83_05G122200 [Erythranthe nasuta]
MLFELAISTLGLALKPLLLAKISCQIGARSFFIIVQTWLELLKFALSLHLIVLWRLSIWAMAALSLPVRAFNALYRERLLEIQLQRLRNELENVIWDRKDLEDKLALAIKERKTMETMLLELEEEHDEAIAKLELLQGEVQDLKAEIQRLNEVQGKALWSNRARADTANDYNTPETNYSKSSRKPHNNNNNKNITQVAKDLFKEEIHDVIKAGSEIYGLSISDEGYVRAGQRDVALSRSLFSAFLSLVVGIIVWESKDPCMPLVVALLTVVTISLVSVRRLFTRIEHKPASDAVLLLCLNWFILGTLMYPTLPRIARLLVPLVSCLGKRAFRWLVL